MKKKRWIIIIIIVAALLFLAVLGWLLLRGNGDATDPGNPSSTQEEAGEQQPETAGETATPVPDTTWGEADFEEPPAAGASDTGGETEGDKNGSTGKNGGTGSTSGKNGVYSGQGGVELPMDVFEDGDDTTIAGDSGNTENNGGTGTGDTSTGDSNTGSDSNELPAIPIR